MKGTNVLEIDVLNASPYMSPSGRHASKNRSPIYCIVELEGEGVRDPGLPGGESRQETSQTPSQEGKTAARSQSPKQDVSGGKKDPSEDAR